LYGNVWRRTYTGLVLRNHTVAITDFIHYASDPELRYSSAGRTEADVNFGVDRMAFKGINIGSIELLGLQSGMENDKDEPNGTLALFKVWELVTRIGRTSSVDLEAFVRVLIFDRIKKENLGTGTKSELLLGILGYLGLTFSDSNLIQPETSIFFGYWKSFLSLENKDRPAAEERTVAAKLTNTREVWRSVILPRAWDRRCFISWRVISYVSRSDAATR